jgi:hypothetical protein
LLILGRDTRPASAVAFSRICSSETSCFASFVEYSSIFSLNARKLSLYESTHATKTVHSMAHNLSDYRLFIYLDILFQPAPFPNVKSPNDVQSLTWNTGRVCGTWAVDSYRRDHPSSRSSGLCAGSYMCPTTCGALNRLYGPCRLIRLTLERTDETSLLFIVCVILRGVDI